MTAQQLGKWSKVGNEINNQPWVAKWTRQGNNHVLRQGEAMIQEQAALEEKKELIKVIHAEGDDSPLRTHVAHNIATRLHEDRLRDSQDGLIIQQRCLNIRKGLGFMQDSRRDLSEYKRKAHEILIGPVKEGPSWAGGGDTLTAGAFPPAVRRRFRNARHSNAADSAIH